MAATRSAVSAKATVVAPNTTVPPKANRMPPSAGPMMVAVCQAEEFQATAFWKCSAGTRLGSSACPAGLAKARAVP